MFLAAAKNPNVPQIIAVLQLLICHSAAVNLPCTGLCCCTNCKNNDIKNELTLMRSSMMMIIGEYQDGDTDREADDSSDCSQGELSEDDEIDND